MPCAIVKLIESDMKLRRWRKAREPSRAGGIAARYLAKEGIKNHQLKAAAKCRKRANIYNNRAATMWAASKRSAAPEEGRGRECLQKRLSAGGASGRRHQQQ